MEMYFHGFTCFYVYYFHIVYWGEKAMIKNIIDKTRQYCITFARVTSLLWKCSHLYTLLFIVINIISGVFNPILIIIWKNIIDSVTILNARRAIFFLILHFLVSMLVYITNQISFYVEETQIDHLNKHILEITMEKIAELEMEQFDEPLIYDKIEKVNNESSERVVSLLRITMNFIKSITVMVGTGVILAQINTLFVVLCFISCIPMFLSSANLSMRKYFLYNERIERIRLISTLKHLFSKYENIKEIKIFRLGNYLMRTVSDIFQTHLQEDKQLRKKYLRNVCFSGVFQNVLSYSFKLYAVFVTVVKRLFSVGDLTMYISAIENFQSAILVLLGNLNNLYIDSLYLNNLFDLLNIEIEGKGKLQFNPNFNKIEFKNVWFKYPNQGKYVLKNINLTIMAKQSYSLVGLNGSGKTTLVKLLTRLYKPTKGEILVDGINIENINASSYYQSIGVIFQDYIKYPFDIGKNIGVGKIEQIDNRNMVCEAAIKAGADIFISNLPKEYETIVQKEWSDGMEISLGQWQKVAIGRAYMSNAPIMILDEPTASLDAEAEYDIYMHFNSVMKDKTCVLISHRLSIDKVIDNIVFMRDGEIIEMGNHARLLEKNGEYAKLYNMQAEAYKIKEEKDD